MSVYSMYLFKHQNFLKLNLNINSLKIKIRGLQLLF